MCFIFRDRLAKLRANLRAGQRQEESVMPLDCVDMNEIKKVKKQKKQGTFKVPGEQVDVPSCEGTLFRATRLPIPILKYPKHLTTYIKKTDTWITVYI